MSQAVFMLAQGFPLADVDPTGYVVVAWAVTFLAVVSYWLYLYRKGKKLALQLPPEERRLIK